MLSTALYITFMVITIFGVGFTKPNIEIANIIFAISMASLIFLGIQVKWSTSIDSKEQARNTWLNGGEIIVLVITLIFSFTLYKNIYVFWLELVSIFIITILLDIYLGTIVGNRVLELKDQNYSGGNSGKSKK